MGKGDKKTKRGKIILGTYGVRRARKKKDKKAIGAKASTEVTVKTTRKEKQPAEKKETKPVKEKAPAKDQKVVKEKEPKAETAKPKREKKAE